MILFAQALFQNLLAQGGPDPYANPGSGINSPGSGSEVVDINTQLSPGGINFFKFDCLNELIVNGIKTAVILGSVAFFIYLIWGGLEWMTSAGDKTQVEAARNRIMHAVTGLAILALSYAIWSLVLYFFGLSGDICDPLGTLPAGG